MKYLRPILAFLAGSAVWSIAWVGGNTGLSVALPSQFSEDGSTENAFILLAMLAYSMVLSAFAGWLAARILRRNRAVTIWVLGISQLLIGIGVQSQFWDVMPLWYHAVFLAGLLPLIVIGARLQKIDSTPLSAPT